VRGGSRRYTPGIRFLLVDHLMPLGERMIGRLKVGARRLLEEALA